jgi:hypothetical protein
METTKREQHQRRMMHWKKSKKTIGFENSFESAFAESSADWPPNLGGGDEQEMLDRTCDTELIAKADTALEEAKSSSMDFQEQGGGGATSSAAPKAPSRVRIDENFIPAAESGSIQSLRSSSGSINMGFSRPSTKAGESSKKVRTSSRMALFNSLLDTTEPPRTATQRFGTIQTINEANSSSIVGDMGSSKNFSMSMMSTKGSSQKFQPQGSRKLT